MLNYDVYYVQKDVKTSLNVQEIIEISGIFQDSLAEAEERVQQLLTEMRDKDEQMAEMEKRLEEEGGTAEALEEKKKKLEGEISGLKNDIQDMELNLQKSREETKSKENQIKTLNDEMARQDESIAKLQKPNSICPKVEAESN